MAGKRQVVTQAIFIADTHFGCQMGLCPPHGAHIDDGGKYSPNLVQRAMWRYWLELWGHWVPYWTQGAAYHIVHVGDVIDGRHHNSTHQFSHNLSDQKKLAVEVLTPVVEFCRKNGGRYFHVRGTEAHVGQSGEDEEGVAETLKAIPNRAKQYARPELWLQLGGGLVHAMHHIGTTGSSHYESTAPHKELTESYQEAGRWRRRAPDCIVRAHRHRYIKTEIAASNDAFAIVLPGWQGKTPFAYKIPGGRQAPPQFGAVCVRWGDDELYSRKKVWTIGRERIES